MMKGIYVMILKLDTETVIKVGKLGKFRFKKGYYAYIGSALGAGGFKRVTRHFNVASGKNMTRKWHIDHLLPCSEVVCAVLIPTEESIECSVASAVGEFYTGIPGFGSSDCSCHAHLFFSETELMDRVVNISNEFIPNESIIISNTI
jgi:Uri superfamily endonuclease